MQAILAVTVPFFALVLLGWLAARAGPLPESAIPGLNAYVLFFALPCMLFRFGASLPLARLADPALLGIYLLCAVLMVALTVAVDAAHGAAGRGGVGLRDAAFGALVAAFPNAGFMGVPLLVALFGDAAAGPVIGAIVIDLVVTSTLCLALAQAEAARSARRCRAARRACGADRAARRADQSAALGDRPRRRARPRSAWSRSRRSARSCACSATRRRRWRCSRSARCCFAPATTCIRAPRSATSCRWR